MNADPNLKPFKTRHQAITAANNMTRKLDRQFNAIWIKGQGWFVSDMSDRELYDNDGLFKILDSRS